MSATDPKTAAIVNHHEAHRDLPLYDNGGAYIWGRKLVDKDILVTDEAVRTTVLRRSRLWMANKHLAILQSTTDLYTQALASLDSLLDVVAAEHAETNDMGLSIPQEFWDTLMDTCRRMQDSIRDSDAQDAKRDALLTAPAFCHLDLCGTPRLSACGVALSKDGVVLVGNDHRIANVTCPACLKAATDPTLDNSISICVTVDEGKETMSLATFLELNGPENVADVAIWARNAKQPWRLRQRTFGGGATPLYTVAVL